MHALDILLIEDNPTDVLLAREALEERRPRDLTVVARLSKAVELLLLRPFDVILLDLGLPDSQGLDTLLRLRRCRPAIPVIVMTGHDDEELARQAVQEGAQDYLVKSQVHSGMLLRSIRYAIERNLAQQTLGEREELFRGAFDFTAVAMVLTDLENRFVRVNEAFARLFGYSAAEMVGMSMAAVTHCDDLAESLARRERLLNRHENFFQIEQRYLHRDGPVFWGLTNVSLVRNAAQKPILYVGQVQDISVQKRAESERDRLFRESLSLLGLLNDDGQIVRLNPNWEQTLGFPLASLHEQSFLSLVHPDDQSATAAQLSQLATSPLPTFFENRLRCQDGSYRSFQWNGSPLPDQQCISVSGHDITERKQADEALRLRDRAMQAVTQGILITDPSQPDNPIVYASPSCLQLTGYSVAEIIGRNCRFLQGPETNPETVARVREAIRDGRNCTVEILNYRKDGTPFWNELTLAPVKNEQGELTHFVGIQNDVSARRQLEEQFRQAQKMEAVGQLAGGVAHDFNNLLTIISGYSELMLNHLPPDDPLVEYITCVSLAGDRAAALTRQLLAFSRKSVLEPKILNLNDVVEETSSLLRRLIGEDVLLTTVFGPNLHQVQVDPDQLSQVLMNLTVNARDAMPRGGLLTIETKNVELDQQYTQFRPGFEPGHYVLLSVSDNGCGMTPEVKARIFEPFYTTKEIGKGTGLGLSVVQGVVKQSGGQLAVHSEPDHGTTFKLYWPAIRESAAVPQRLTELLGDLRGSETVLVVEDEEGVRTLAALVLQTNGYHVLVASDGAEALRLIAGHGEPIDLLVTDVVMPGMGGREVADMIQASIPHLKVLYTSGYTDDAVVRHGILQAECAFLQKPYSPLALARKVRMVLDQR